MGDGAQRMGFRRFVQARMQALRAGGASFARVLALVNSVLNNVLSHIIHAPIWRWLLWLSLGGRAFGAVCAFFFLSFSIQRVLVFSMD